MDANRIPGRTSTWGSASRVEVNSHRPSTMFSRNDSFRGATARNLTRASRSFCRIETSFFGSCPNVARSSTFRMIPSRALANRCRLERKLASR